MCSKVRGKATVHAVGYIQPRWNAMSLCRKSIKALRCFPNDIPAGAYSLPEAVKHGNGCLPGYAGIGH